MNAKYQRIVETLRQGQSTEYREGGSSMEPRLSDGSLIKIHPITDHDELRAGQIVLCKVRGRMMTHLIWSKQWRAKKGSRRLWFQIGNNHGHENGWCPAEQVYGLVEG